MKKKLIHKYLISLGLLLFFTLLLPLTSSKAAWASSIDKEKNVDYRLNLKNVTLVKGKDFQLKAYNLKDGSKVSFKSNDSEIASVNDDGIISANKVGDTIITVTIKDGSTSTNLDCSVTVGPPAFSVKSTRSRIFLGIDESDQLRVILKPSNTAESARFSSYDSSIASISIGGRIYGRSLGFTYVFAEIDAQNDDGTQKFAYCPVIVTSSSDSALLKDYFDNHPELDIISEYELNSAMEKFFNGVSDGTPLARKYTGSALVDALNKYLDNKFDLVSLRKAREASISKSSVSQTEVVSDSSIATNNTDTTNNTAITNNTTTTNKTTK